MVYSVRQVRKVLVPCLVPPEQYLLTATEPKGLLLGYASRHIANSYRSLFYRMIAKEGQRSVPKGQYHTWKDIGTLRMQLYSTQWHIPLLEQTFPCSGVNTGTDTQPLGVTVLVPARYSTLA